jgi:hypothetical protein
LENLEAWNRFRGTKSKRGRLKKSRKKKKGEKRAKREEGKAEMKTKDLPVTPCMII